MRAFRLFAAAIVVGISLPALADPPTLQIQQQATLDAVGVVVPVVVNCGDGASDALVVVMVRQGNETGEGVLPFASTGNRQVLNVQVVGVFAPGDAAATAELSCAGMPEGLVTGAFIKIVAP